MDSVVSLCKNCGQTRQEIMNKPIIGRYLPSTLSLKRWGNSCWSHIVQKWITKCFWALRRQMVNWWRPNFPNMILSVQPAMLDGLLMSIDSMLATNISYYIWGTINKMHCTIFLKYIHVSRTFLVDLKLFLSLPWIGDRKYIFVYFVDKVEQKDAMPGKNLCNWCFLF